MTSTRFQNLRLAIRRWRYPLIVLIVVLLGGMAVVGQWVHGKIRNRQAYSLAGQAAEDLRQGNLKQARMGVDTALRLKPAHPAATRLLARIQAATGEPEKALATFQKLTDERQLSLEDLQLFATLASDKGEQQLAKRLADFAGANGSPAFPHLLQARVHARNKKPAEVEASLRAAVQADPGDETRAVLLDFLLANRRQVQSASEIAGILQDFSTRNDTLGVKALALGLQTGLMNPDKRSEWIEKIRAHPQANIRHRLLADSVDASLHPASKPDIAARLQEFAKSRSLPDRSAAARWLANNGTTDQAFSILPLEDALQSSDSFIVWLDANALDRNWTASLDALARPDNPLPGHHSSLFQGLALRGLGKTSESQAAFQKAVNEAGDEPARFAFVTTYLFGCNEASLFEASLAKIPGQPLLAPQLFPSLFPIVTQKRDALLSLRVLETLGTSFALADNAAFQNELAHHRILLDKKTSLEFIRKHCEENPDDLFSLSTLAFHRLKKGDSPGAMALFDSYGPDVDARTLPPRILCIYSATLAANGKTDLARKIASIIPRGSLSRQEAEFLTARLKPAN